MGANPSSTKSTTTQTVTTTNNTNIIQNRSGTDAAALINSLSGLLGNIGVGSSPAANAAAIAASPVSGFTSELDSTPPPAAVAAASSSSPITQILIAVVAGMILYHLKD